MTKPQPKKIYRDDTLESQFERVKQSTVPMPTMEKIPGITPEDQKTGGNFSQLNFGKLNDTYAKQDAGQLEALREQMTPEQLKEQEKTRFFKKYKQDDEEYYKKRKREDEEKKLRKEQEEAERKRLEEQERLKGQKGDIPKGKVRKNIFGKTKNKAETYLPPEIKPGYGRQ